MCEIEMVIKPTAGIGRRLPLKLGLHPFYMFLTQLQSKSPDVAVPRRVSGYDCLLQRLSSTRLLSCRRAYPGRTMESA